MDFVEEFMKEEDPNAEMPKGWSVQSRCKPEPEKGIKALLEELEQLEERIRRKAQKAGALKEEVSGMKTMHLRERLRKAFEEDTRKDGPQVEEEHVHRMRKALQGFVIAPVDKLSGDAAIM